MSSAKSRINKWRKYREEIDSNSTIHFSILNSDQELKKMFESIDFDVIDAYNKAGYLPSFYQNVERKSHTKEKKEVENILRIIEQNETINEKSHIIKEFNSHKYDEIINNFFPEFLDKDDLENQEKQETTDLKINKINIIDNNDKVK